MDTLLMLPIQRRVVDTNTLLSKVESTHMVVKTLDINTNSQIQVKIQTVNWMEKKLVTNHQKRWQPNKHATIYCDGNKLDTNIPLMVVMVSTVMVLRLLQVVVMTIDVVIQPHAKHVMVSGGFLVKIPYYVQPYIHYIYLYSYH